MLSTSFAFRNRVAKNSKTIHKAQLTFADGTTVDLSGEDLMAGPSFSEGTSSSSSFDVGGAVIGRHEFVLRNEFGQYDDADFTGATVIAYVGVDVDGEGSVEWLRKGIYGVEQPKTYGNTIKLSALDNMRLLEVPYSEISTAYPATLGTIVSDVCMECGMTLLTQDFDGRTVTIPARPDDSALSCLDVISYAAQATGHFAKCDPLGRLVFKWYDTAAFESEGWLDGGTFSTTSTPYSDGDMADGGAFHDGGDSADGGSFAEGRFAHLFAWSQLSVATDDVVITGIRVTADDELLEDGTRGYEGETALYGDEGYVLDISGNPLIVYGTASAAAARIGGKVVGMRFRPFDGQVVGDPSLEAGDPVVITDRRQKRYVSYITQTTWRAGSYQSVSCGAETPSRNSAATYSALTRAIVENRGRIRAERDARAYALQILQQELAESGGLYETDVEQSDHSVVHYLHDKPTLADSQIVWKLTAEAFGVSVHGVAGPYLGFDAWGNAILNSIYAIGLNADHIVAGTLRSENGDFQLNLSTGVATVSGDSTVGDRTVDELLGDVDGTITDVEVQFNSNTSNNTPPAESDVGWSTTAPTWEAGHYIWQRIAKFSASGPEYSDPVMISGRDGATGTNAAAIYLYARGVSAPSKDMADPLTYTFSSGSLSGSLGSWSRNIPAGTDTCWVTMVTAIGNSATDTIARSEWSDAIALSTAGVDGLNQATVMLFQRRAAWRVDVSTLVAPSGTVTVSGTTATIPGTVSGTTLTLASDKPAKPSVQTTYTFANGNLNPVPSGWSRSVPSGDDPCYVTTAAAISSSATDTIAASEWADVEKLSENGISPTVYSVRYAVGTSGTTAPTTGWQSAIPATQQGKWLWVRTTYTDGRTSDTCSYMGTDGEDGTSVVVQSSTKTGGVTIVKLVDSDGNETTLSIADGEDGATGTPGANGKNIHIAWATAADGSSGFSTEDSAGKTYIGVYDSAESADSQDPADYSWSRIKGENGLNQMSIVLYKRAASQPSGSASAPSGNTTYSFVNHALTGSLNGWSQAIPSGTDPCWAIAATASSSTDTDLISASEWSQPPVKLVENGADGTDGAAGAAGLNQATIYLYRRAASTPSKPSSSTTYTFATGALSSVPTGWSRTVPSGTNPCWVTTAVAISNGATDTIASSEWSTPVKLAENGAKGDTGVGVASYTPQWYLSTSSSTTTGGSWSATQPAWVSGRYLWERTFVEYDDGSTDYVPSQDGMLATAINAANSTASSANTKAERALALVREYGDGVLVCRQGNTVGALVNADGSFDVVSVTWSGGVPTASSSLASFGTTVLLGSHEFGLELAGDGSIRFLMEGERAIDLSYTPATVSGGTDWHYDLDFMLGTLIASKSGRYTALKSDGYPLIFKDGNSLMYWDGQSIYPQQFPLGSGQAEKRGYEDAIVAASGSSLSIDGLITVTGYIAMVYGEIGGSVSPGTTKIGRLSSSAFYPEHYISMFLSPTVGNNLDEVKLDINTSGEVFIVTSSGFGQQARQVYGDFSATYIRQG